MKNVRLDALIQAHLDDQLTPKERMEFEQILLDSAAARQRFWELAEVHGLAQEASRMTWSEVTESKLVAMTPDFNQTSNTSWWRSLGAIIRPLAAGMIIGGLSASVAWAYAAPRAHELLNKAKVFFADDFESGIQPLSAGVPTVADVWGGDFSKLTGGEQGITPSQGQHMLRFNRPDNEQTPKGEIAHVTEMWRIVDLRTKRSEWGGRPFVIEAMAKINAVPLPSDQRYAFGLSMLAFRGEISEAPVLWKSKVEAALSSADKEELVDRDAKTWQTLSNQVTVPADADFLLMQIRVTCKSQPTDEVPEYKGHYVDDVVLRVLPSFSLP
ncbi:hypothetical protein BH11VER1_BH11VER1_07580 [soil metagenome]